MKRANREKREKTAMRQKAMRFSERTSAEKRNRCRLPALLLLLTCLCACFAGCGEAPFRGIAPLPSGSVSAGSPGLGEDGLPVSADPSGSSGNGKDPAANSVSFLAAGDVIIHEAVFTDAMKRASQLAATDGYGEKYYFTSMFDGVASGIAAADLAFVNFECPVAGDGYGALGYPNFNAPTAAGNAIASLGFDVVNIANNHMLDMDGMTTGLKNTVSYWKTKDLLTIGGYTSKDYDDLRIVEKNGIRIAFLSYTYGTNNGRVNSGSPEYIVPTIKDDVLLRQLKKAREAADAVVVSMHWGEETSYATNMTVVSAEQRRLAKLINENGGDVILGHHSHALQEVELLRSADGHETLCYYSLGNFISTQHPYTNLVGGFASFSLEKSEDGGVKVKNPLLIPHVTYYNKDRSGLQVMLLSDMTEELTASHGSQLRSDYNGVNSFTLADWKKVVTRTVSPQFLPAYLR